MPNLWLCRETVGSQKGACTCGIGHTAGRVLHRTRQSLTDRADVQSVWRTANGCPRQCRLHDTKTARLSFSRAEQVDLSIDDANGRRLRRESRGVVGRLVLATQWTDRVIVRMVGAGGLSGRPKMETQCGDSTTDDKSGETSKDSNLIVRKNGLQIHEFHSRPEEEPSP